MTEARPVLVCQGVYKSFNGVPVLEDVALTARIGEVVGLVGQNGAGKSTLIKILSGAYALDRGRILIDGRPVLPRSPRAALADGIATIYQDLSLCPNLSVAENLFLGDTPTAGPFVDWNRMRTATRALLDDLGVSLDPDARTASLPLSAQQAVEIAKALRKQPKVLILDEPTSALTRSEKERLYRIIQRLKTHTAVIYISHYLEEIIAYCDRVVVLRDGRVVSDEATAVTSLQRLVVAMVSEEITEFFPKTNVVQGSEPAFEVRSLSTHGTSPPLVDVTFAARAGEIVGLTGLSGSGYDVFAEAVGGARPFSGTVAVAGQALRIRDIQSALAAGVVYVPGDRKSQGLVMSQNAYSNAALPVARWLQSRLGLVSEPRLERHVRPGLQKMRIIGDMKRDVRYLSGGNQQKVVLTKMTDRLLNPRVVVLNDPTRGIDVSAKRDIYELMMRWANSGAAIVFISSDLEEVYQLCDSVYVFKAGRAQRLPGRPESKASLQVAIELGGGESTAVLSG